jgi:putative endonuclease
MTHLHPYYIYIVTNKSNEVYYVGVTNDLRTRVWEHKTHQDSKSFTARYNIHKLVYFENFEFIDDAIKREKFIKGKSRKWKQNLVCAVNPAWNELDPERSI